VARPARKTQAKPSSRTDRSAKAKAAPAQVSETRQVKAEEWAAF
jgi:hypothetical protein